MAGFTRAFAFGFATDLPLPVGPIILPRAPRVQIQSTRVTRTLQKVTVARGIGRS